MAGSCLWLRSQIISRDQNTRDCFTGDLTLEMGVTNSDSIPVREKPYEGVASSTPPSLVRPRVKLPSSRMS